MGVSKSSILNYWSGMKQYVYRDNNWSSLKPSEKKNFFLKYDRDDSFFSLGSRPLNEARPMLIRLYQGKET